MLYALKSMGMAVMGILIFYIGFAGFVILSLSAMILLGKTN